MAGIAVTTRSLLPPSDCSYETCNGYNLWIGRLISVVTPLDNTRITAAQTSPSLLWIRQKFPRLLYRQFLLVSHCFCSINWISVEKSTIWGELSFSINSWTVPTFHLCRGKQFLWMHTTSSCLITLDCVDFLPRWCSWSSERYSFRQLFQKCLRIRSRCFCILDNSVAVVSEVKLWNFEVGLSSLRPMHREAGVSGSSKSS